MREGFAQMFTEAAYLLTADESADDPDILASSLNFFLKTIQTRRAQCSEYAFEGEGGELVGPFDLAAGDYVFTGSLTEHGIINLDTLTDECSLDIISQSSILFTESGDQQSLLQTDQTCRLVLTANTNAPWTVTIAPLQ
jgi:hypothetical protein